MKLKQLIIIVILILLALLAGTFISCSSGTDDPQPAYDCHTLKADADRSQAAWQVLVHNPPASNATDAVKAEYQQKRTAAEKKYIADYKLWSANCQ